MMLIEGWRIEFDSPGDVLQPDATQRRMKVLIHKWIPGLKKIVFGSSDPVVLLHEL